jgi:hypothetical protein
VASERAELVRELSDGVDLGTALAHVLPRLARTTCRDLVVAGRRLRCAVGRARLAASSRQQLPRARSRSSRRRRCSASRARSSGDDGGGEPPEPPGPPDPGGVESICSWCADKGPTTAVAASPTCDACRRGGRRARVSRWLTSMWRARSGQ